VFGLLRNTDIGISSKPGMRSDLETSIPRVTNCLFVCYHAVTALT
jgi:hypothetical protein